MLEVRALAAAEARAQSAHRASAVSTTAVGAFELIKAGGCSGTTQFKNYAIYSNEGGFYDDVAAYLRKRKLMW